MKQIPTAVATLRKKNKKQNMKNLLILSHRVKNSNITHAHTMMIYKQESYMRI